MQNIHVTNGANEVTFTSDVPQQVQSDQQVVAQQIAPRKNTWGLRGLVLSVLSVLLSQILLLWLRKLPVHPTLWSGGYKLYEYFGNLIILDFILITLGFVFSYKGLEKPKGLAITGMILSLIELPIPVYLSYALILLYNS